MEKPELLSPVGDFECLKAAVQNGANSVYLGASQFNARYSAENFDNNSIIDAILYAKSRGVSVFLVLNILITNDEFNDAYKLAKEAYENGVDALIIQDLGLASAIHENFPDFPLHASTQMTVHNLDGVKFLESLGFKRVVLSRELSLNEIEYICKNTSVEIEVFIHGALCVSYSGQCLFSSLIGGRSGNRGKCAGTCRLPFNLINNNEETLNSGYLLSTKDLCGLEYLPELIRAGATSFKIEGRMKTPEYVATVTRIYRKYINKVLNNEPYKIEEHDMRDLLIVFNRGNFSNGFLNNEGNKSLIFKEKPNHLGIYMGTITKINSNRGYIELNTKTEVSIGDQISLDYKGKSSSYNVSELMIRNINQKTVKANSYITIGRVKGDILIGQKVYLTQSKELKELSINSYTNVENKHTNLGCNITIKSNTPISITIKILSGNYSNLKTDIITDIVAEQAQNAPLTKEKLIQQFTKTNNTVYRFENFNINLDENLFLPISQINEIRRKAIDEIDEIIAQSIFRECPTTAKETYTLNISETENLTHKKISVLLNILNTTYNYSNLENIDNIYIPLRFFLDTNYENTIKSIVSKFKTYIYMPIISKTNYTNILKNKLENIMSNFNIHGAVISNLSQLEYVKFYDIDLIGNYTLNAYNSKTISTLKTYKLNKFILSPELNSEIIHSLENENSELTVYGNAPVMNTNYCVLGNTNKCYKECPHYCKTNDKYHLKDRLNFKFRVLPDNIDTVSTIYNSKTTAISSNNFSKISNLKIDILDETIEEINYIIVTALNGSRLEGNNYTNANLNREI